MQSKTPDKKERRKYTHLLVLWLGICQDDRLQWLVASAVNRRPNTKKGCALACYQQEMMAGLPTKNNYLRLSGLPTVPKGSEVG
jgi:hypothetical protein